MALRDCEFGAPTSGGGGGGGTGGDGTIVTTATAGLVGTNLVAGQPGDITMPAIISPGSTVVAIAIEWVGPPVVNTADGWTEILEAQHDANVFDASVRAVWKHFPGGGAQIQSPFTIGSTSNCLAAWEIRGLDPTFTPNFYSVDYAGAGASITLTDDDPTAGLYLFLGAHMPISGDAGAATHVSSDFVVDTDVHGTGGAGGLAMHAAYPTAPGFVSDTATWPSGHPSGGLMIGLTLGDVDPTGTSTTTPEYVGSSIFTTLKLNGATVTTRARSLNVVGDATLTDDGAGNVTLTLPSVSPAVVVPLAIGSNPPTLVAAADGRLIPIVWE